MPHEGQGGGLLVVDSFPNVPEARVKRHLAGTLGQRLKQMASAAYPAVAYATALRCPPKGAAPPPPPVPVVPLMWERRGSGAWRFVLAGLVGAAAGAGGLWLWGL